MSSSDSDVAASDLSLVARELDERLQEPPSTPLAFETTAGAGKGKGKGKGKRGKKAVEGQLTEDQKQEAIDFLRERPYLYNRSHSGYKDAAKRNREWKEFADQLGVPVAVLMSWYRCMRVLLGRAKKAKTKSGSADVHLPRAQARVWTHMQFLVPYISLISSDTLGPRKRKTTAEPVELTESEAELDPDQPAPSAKWIVPGHAGIHGARPSASTPVSASRGRCVGPSARKASGDSAPSTCCGHLCSRLDSMMQHLAKPELQFWTTLQWRVDHFTPAQTMDLQEEVWNVVVKHVRRNGRKPDPIPTTIRADPSPATWFQPADRGSGDGLGADSTAPPPAMDQRKENKVGLLGNNNSRPTLE